MKRSILFTVLVITLITGWLVCVFCDAGRSSKEEDMHRINESVHRCIMECYAIEGRYPRNITYLKENYGISFNEDLYQIHYRYHGSNMLPEFAVFEKGAK